MDRITRDYMVFFRVTKREKEQIETDTRVAGYPTVSEYCRAELRKSRIVVIDDLSKFLAELHKQGSNLNQVAKVANTQKFVSKEILAELKKSTDTFATVSSLLNDIIIKIDTIAEEMEEEREEQSGSC